MRFILFILFTFTISQALACELSTAAGKPLDQPGLTGLSDPAGVRPNLSFPQVANWLAGAAMASLTVKDGTLAGPSNKNFTNRGEEEFGYLLENNPKLSNFIRNNTSASALIQHVPVLIYAGVSGNRYVWNYDVPLMLLSNSSGQLPLFMTLHIRVIRSADPVHPKGIAIDRWNLAEGRSY